MNSILKSLGISVLFLMQLPALADIEIPGLESGRVNPLDKKTEFINNNLIAFSEVKTDNVSKKFIAVIPSIGSKRVVLYEINPLTNALTESVTLKGNLYSPFYLTFDPTGSHLYALSSTRNIVTQYTFDQNSGTYKLEKRNHDAKAKNTDFQTACDHHYFFAFDYTRTLQIFPTEHKAYITCQDKKIIFLSRNINLIPERERWLIPLPCLTNKSPEKS